MCLLQNNFKLVILGTLDMSGQARAKCWYKHVENLKSVLKLDVVTPVRSLPNTSKIVESCMHGNVSKYFETKFSKFQCGFRIGYNTQDCLLAVVKNCKKALDNGKEYGAMLNDPSKDFDCLPHDLTAAKLHVYVFFQKSLKVIKSYLTDRI